MNKAFESILDMLSNIHRVVKTDEDAEWNRAIYKSAEIVHEVAEEYNNCWIPCNERLPEKNGMYLCTQNSYDLVTNKKIIRVSTELVEFYNGEWRRAKNLVITHWQPLPEPFKENVRAKI